MQATDTPQRRPELVLTPVTEEERTLTVVHDPQSGRYFRIREVEGFILSQMDGLTPLEAAHQAVLREFPGVRLSQGTVLKFAEKLGGLGWLVGTEGSAAKPRRAPLYRRLLRMKLPPVPADPFFQAILPLVRVLYHPLSLALVAAGLLFVGYWAFFSLDELARYGTHFHSLGGIALLWVGFLIVGFCHEMGHGATCRYFGAKTYGVGFFLMYGLPCFYCDVSGAWTLSSRRERLLIGLAGLGWQFVAGALAFVFWKALEPQTLPARICHVMVGTCGVTALLNLNPFIKLDGYYLLSDWWRIPNLREKSLTYFRGRLSAFFLGTPAPKLGSARERRLFFWFGLASSCYSFLLVSLLVWKLSHWLLQSFHGTGALILGAILMTVLSSWLRNMFKGVSQGLRPSAGENGGPPAGSGKEGEEGSTAKPRRAPLFPKFRLLFILGGIMAAFCWFWNAKWTFFVASPCTLEAEGRVAVRPLVDGVLQEVRYREGDRVHAGDTFAVLETYDLQKNREQLQQRRVVAEAATNVVRQQVPLVEAEKQRDVAQARQEVRKAETDLAEKQDLYPIRRAESERKVQEARAALDADERVADRVRTDERAVADGNLTPPMQAITERIARVQSQRDLAKKEVQRAAYLVSEGALQRQKLDSAATELQSLDKEQAALRSELEGQQKDLRERREDAEATVRRRRAAYEASLEGQRLVEQETRPERLDVVRQDVQTRKEVLDTTEQLRKAADVKRAEAEAKKLEARPLVVEQERLEKKIKQARLAAPADGVVSTVRLEEKLGKKYSKGETLAWIDSVETLTARISVDEKEIGEVRKGLPVQLRVGAFPDRLFQGKVMEVSPRTSAGNGRGAYEVRLQIRNPHDDLRPGITGYAKIIGGKRPLREVAFRRLHRYLRTEVWTWF